MSYFMYSLTCITNFGFLISVFVLGWKLSKWKLSKVESILKHLTFTYSNSRNWWVYWASLAFQIEQNCYNNYYSTNHHTTMKLWLKSGENPWNLRYQSKNGINLKDTYIWTLIFILNVTFSPFLFKPHFLHSLTFEWLNPLCYWPRAFIKPAKLMCSGV